MSRWPRGLGSYNRVAKCSKEQSSVTAQRTMGNHSIQIVVFLKLDLQQRERLLLMRDKDAACRGELCFKLLIPLQAHQRVELLPKPVDSQLIPSIFDAAPLEAAMVGPVLGWYLSLLHSPWESW